QVDRGGTKALQPDWSIYDLTTGRRRYGPQRDSYFLHQRWSPDGQWFCATVGEPGKHDNLLQLRSFKTGEVVHEFQTPEGCDQAIPYFSPDSTSMCISWAARDSNMQVLCNGKKIITIHALPSGKEIKRVELPRNHIWLAQDWDGETLMLFDQMQLSLT